MLSKKILVKFIYWVRLQKGVIQFLFGVLTWTFLDWWQWEVMMEEVVRVWGLQPFLVSILVVHALPGFQNCALFLKAYGSIQQKRATERARCLFCVKGALFNSLIIVCYVLEKKPRTYIDRFFSALSNGAIVFIAKRFLPDENSCWILKAIFLKVYHARSVARFCWTLLYIWWIWWLLLLEVHSSLFLFSLNFFFPYHRSCSTLLIDALQMCILIQLDAWNIRIVFGVYILLLSYPLPFLLSGLYNT